MAQRDQCDPLKVIETIALEREKTRQKEIELQKEMQTMYKEMAANTQSVTYFYDGNGSPCMTLTAYNNPALRVYLSLFNLFKIEK